MSCVGVLGVNPVCQASALVGKQANAVADGAFSGIASHFTAAATDATQWLWKELDRATTLDLRSPQLLRELAATGAIAAVLCMGLFLIQVIASIMRREPGGIGRALGGLVTSFVGSALALAATRALLGAVDALSAGVVSYTLHTNVAGIGAMLDFTALASVPNPAVQLMFAAVILVAVVIVWAAMMVRKLMLLIAAVLAPLAFAGATADITRAWTRRWIEFVCAMVVSKLLLVIILSIGINVLFGAGQGEPGVTQTGTQLAAGSLILLMGGFSPWIAIRMFSFAGDTLHAAHATASQASTGARTVVAAPQKIAALHWQVGKLAAAAGAGGGAAAGAAVAARPRGRPTGENSTTPEPPDTASTSGQPQRPPDQQAVRGRPVEELPPADAGTVTPLRTEPTPATEQRPDQQASPDYPRQTPESTPPKQP